MEYEILSSRRSLFLSMMCFQVGRYNEPVCQSRDRVSNCQCPRDLPELCWYVFLRRYVYQSSVRCCLFSLTALVNAIFVLSPPAVEFVSNLDVSVCRAWPNPSLYNSPQNPFLTVTDLVASLRCPFLERSLLASAYGVHGTQNQD